MRDEAFAKLKVYLPNVDRPSPVLKVKVDSGAQRNILQLRIFKSMFPDCGKMVFQQAQLTPSQTKLTTYNGINIPQAWCMFY